MPLYEYECTACKRRTEKIQKFSDPEITICPHCGGTLERVISAPAIAFKGGGWYADGYGNAKPKSSGDGDAKTSSEPATDSGSKSADAKTSESAGAKSTDTKSSDKAASSPAPSKPAPAAAVSASAPDKK